MNKLILQNNNNIRDFEIVQLVKHLSLFLLRIVYKTRYLKKVV